MNRELRRTMCPAILLVLMVLCLVGNSQAVPIQTFTTDPGWTTTASAGQNGNSYGYSLTNFATGAANEAGGTFSRSQADGYYADINLTQSFTLNDTFSASGTLHTRNVTAGYISSGASQMFIGHLSSSTSATSREFIGISFEENSGPSLRWQARFQMPGGGGGESANIGLTPGTSYAFSYTYDPTLGSFGRITVTIGSNTQFVDLSMTERNSGAVFNAFGIGIALNLNSQTDAAKTTEVYMDNVSYSGLIPEPTSLILFSVGAGMMLVQRRRRLAF